MNNPVTIVKNESIIKRIKSLFKKESVKIPFNDNTQKVQSVKTKERPTQFRTGGHFARFNHDVTMKMIDNMYGKK